MKGTESKKLESSFLAVCIAGGVGTIIYLALNKMGLTDFFGSKKPLDKESLAKEILKKETLVNEQLKQEILVNEQLKQEILVNERLKIEVLKKEISNNNTIINKNTKYKNFIKGLIKNEVSKNLEIAEEVFNKYKNLTSSLQKNITASELFIKSRETDITRLYAEITPVKMVFQMSSIECENLLKKEQDLIKEKSLLESKIENLTPSEKTSWVKADIEQSRKRLLECKTQLKQVSKEFKEITIITNSVKNDLNIKENMINYMKSQCVSHKDNIALKKTELDFATKQLAMNEIKIQKLKSKLQEE